MTSPATRHELCVNSRWDVRSSGCQTHGDAATVRGVVKHSHCDGRLTEEETEAHRVSLEANWGSRTSLGMQPDSRTPPPVLLLCEDGVCRGCVQDFAELLPTEMSVQIFSELDTASLCSASRTCRRWNHIIEGSEQLWRDQCLLVRALCQREVDGDRREGLSWKVVLVRNYTRSRVKSAWLRGRFSHVRSADELLGCVMTPLDAESWGEILQAELDR